jgi:hypothetical protein
MRIAGHDNKLITNQTVNQSQNFGIGDPTVVIEILRNRLYEHKIRTLVQEYMCNARDAHREVKQSKRIEVTAPTMLEPTFKVRDFGPGITPDRMANVFVLYGASTKRASNTQTGGFGIGAKSAWSYADGFIIVSITDGVKRTYHAHVGMSNVGQLDLLSEVASDEPTGCEIQVAVKPNDIREFTSSIRRASAFWTDEEAPTFTNLQFDKFFVNTYKIGNLEVLPANSQMPNELVNGYGKRHLLVVDGVPYELSQSLIGKTKDLEDLYYSFVRGCTIIRVPNGLVQVSASREKLDDSEFTRKGLEKIALKLIKDVKNHLDAESKLVTSVKTFIDSHVKLSSYFLTTNLSYKGFTFNGEELETNLLRSLRLRKHYAARDGKFKDAGCNFIPYLEVKNIFIKTVDESKVTFNRRLKAHLEQGNSALYVIEERPLTTTDANGKVEVIKYDVAPAKALAELQGYLGTFKDLQTIQFVVPPRQPSARTKVQKLAEQQTIHVLYGHGKHTRYITLQELINSKRVFVWMTVKDFYKKTEVDSDLINEFRCDLGGSNFTDALKAKSDRPIMIAVSNEVAELIALEPNFMPYKAWRSSITLTDKLRARMMITSMVNAKSVSFLNTLPGLTNKKLLKLVNEYKVVQATLARNEDVHVADSIVQMFKDDAQYQAFKKYDSEMHKLIKSEYPLVEIFTRSNAPNTDKDQKTDLAWYLNNK